MSLWRSSSIRTSPEWQPNHRNRATTFAAPQLQVALVAKQRLETRANVGEADVELTSGQSSRAKRFRLKGLDAEEADKRLRVALDEAKTADGRPGRRV